MPLKPFEQVQPGDIGLDYAEESGVVISTGDYGRLRKYDSTGACDELEEDEKSRMVAVKTEDGNSLLYTYGSDGFGVYV